MRIAVSSTQCNGKTRFINSFLDRWPMYKKPESSYRDLIKDNKLPLNKEATVESQKIIRDALVDQAINNASEKFCIHDRCILDNLVHTLWLAEKGEIDDSDFIAESFLLTRETLKMYDIIFFLPISEKSPVIFEEREHRDLDFDFRFEINNIFLGIESSYKEYSGLVFPLTDSPALIELVGDEDLLEKTNTVAFYLEENGEFKKSDESLMKSISELAQEDALAAELLNQVRI
jgi:hypothetical protein